jgi:phospholipid/cholesterol/gamma-HCH transport system substrate-binding protein
LKVTNETKIGALTAVAITVLILGYSFLRGNDVFSGSNRFYTVYKSVDGLTVSKPVLVNGFQIGMVSKMKLQPDGRTLVEFKIEKQYNVPKNTTAKLSSVSLLGDKAIVFQYGNSNINAEDKDTLRAEIQGGLAESLQPIQAKAENLMSKLDSSLASINKILNPNFQKNVDRSFASIANSLQTLEGTTKKIDALVASQTSHINGILSNAETVSSNLKTSTGHLTGISSNLEKVSTDLASSNIKKTLDNASKAVADLQATIAKMNSTQGTLGSLINDN